MRLWIGKGDELAIEGGLVVLEEHATFFCHCDGADELLFGELPLGRGPDGRFVLRVGHWAGALRLRARRLGQVTSSLRVEVLPRPSKLDAEAWARMLDDLDMWLPGITAGLEGGKHGTVGAGTARLPGLAVALIELVPAICDAVRAIVATPREQVHELWLDVPLHAVRRISAGTLAGLATDARGWSALRGPVTHMEPVVQPATPEPCVPSLEGEPTLDHPANRYVVWLLRRVEATLERLIAWLGTARAEDEETAAWARSRAHAAEEANRLLVRTRRLTFLQRLRPEAPGAAAQVTVQNDPAYARLLRLCRPFLSPVFRPPAEGEEDTLPVRPSFGLYELWTFLAMRRLVEERLGGARWRGLGLQKLFSGTGNGAAMVARCPEGSLRIEFNPVFRSFPTRAASRRFSLSRKRRPDLVVSWAPTDGEPRWVCLDAKYRVEPRALGRAFASAHLYRDSLIWQDFGGRCVAAWLLVPAKRPGAECWFEERFLDDYGTGAFLLRPGEVRPYTLGLRLFAALGIPA